MIGEDFTDEQLDYILRLLRTESPKRYAHLKRIDYRRRGLLYVDPRAMAWGDDVPPDEDGAPAHVAGETPDSASE